MKTCPQRKRENTHYHRPFRTIKSTSFTVGGMFAGGTVAGGSPVEAVRILAAAVAGIADTEEQVAGMSIGDIGWVEDWNTAGGQEVLGSRVLAAAVVVAKEAAVSTWMEVVQAFHRELWD